MRAIGVFQDAVIDEQSWPVTVPAVGAFLEVARAGAPFGGWEFGPGVTFLVGENGSGKSTLIEGIAEAVGLPPEGGSRNGGARTRSTESPLGGWLKIVRGPMGAKGGFFLRAETMHQYFSWLEDGLEWNESHPDARLHRLSHGESFNDLLDRKIDHERFEIGLALLDEPEAALSFGSILRWLAALDRMRSRGTQVICATHSPILASLPGATILELGEWGIRTAAWEDLELVQHHRGYLQAPERYLRHLLAGRDGS
ncbi:AAA family ATPase [Leucobacter weissii]|uniref:AAA family ATPase n=1 Tax=Leucobacter weissii TaxID=1983706 RepID=A0A939S7A7_9MICO|nr:AAA family ATPase [Leucobacter weissii]